MVVICSDSQRLPQQALIFRSQTEALPFLMD
jgi:hypothetical protein